MANVRIDGLKDLGTRVKNMGKDARAAAGQALRKGAEIIREEAHVPGRLAARTAIPLPRDVPQSIWPTS